MKARELIAALQRMAPDLPVTVWSEDADAWVEVTYCDVNINYTAVVLDPYLDVPSEIE